MKDPTAFADKFIKAEISEKMAKDLEGALKELESTLEKREAAASFNKVLEGEEAAKAPGLLNIKPDETLREYQDRVIQKSFEQDKTLLERYELLKAAEVKFDKALERKEDGITPPQPKGEGKDKGAEKDIEAKTKAEVEPEVKPEVPEKEVIVEISSMMSLNSLMIMLKVS